MGEGALRKVLTDMQILILDDDLPAREQIRSLLEQLMRRLDEADRTPPCRPRVKVKTAEGILFLPVDQIDWLEAADNYVVVHAGKKTHILRETLQGLEASLSQEGFARISRSALVNLDHVAELRHVCKGQGVVVLQDGSRLPTRREIQDLAELVAAPQHGAAVVVPDPGDDGQVAGLSEGRVQLESEGGMTLAFPHPRVGEEAARSRSRA
jgi:hypothetical protein